MDEAHKLERANESGINRAEFRNVLSGVLASAGVGVAIGLLFPMVATVLMLLREDGIITWATVVHMHKGETLLQIIDSIPVILGLTFSLIGRSVSKLEYVIETLEYRVSQRTAALADSKANSDSANRARSVFLARISSYIVGLANQTVRACELLLGSALDARQREHLGHALGASRNVEDSLRSMLVVSEIDAGELRVQEREFSPVEVLEHTIAKISQNLPESICLAFGSAGAVPDRVEADPTHLVNAFVTLLRAALLTNKEGTIDVEVACSRGSQAQSAMLEIAIECPHSNIPQEQLDRMFSQLASTDPRGCGFDAKLELDLVMSQKLIELIGGRVAARSQGQRGTKYWMTVPVQPSRIMYDSTESADIESRLSHMRVA